MFVSAIPFMFIPMNRALNLICAALGLLLLLPLLAVIALLVKCDDGGPVFYGHPRVGKGFRSFRLLKFRSMAVNADKAGPLTKPADHRITRAGRFLRKYKLDELPQLWNVLTGDMQLVGARPEVDRYVAMFREQYALLLSEPPGITDPASLAYRCEEKLFVADRMEQQYVSEILPEKLRLSLEYQRRRSLPSDLHVLLNTVLGLTT
jgi:lipopolysaccharide/colanic/teichoic acid biosynthesis glycosyltransferase